MPYNTRRKSVSLSQLGIHVPASSRSSSHRSPPASATTPPADEDMQHEQQHPSKKLKRSHSSAGDEPLSPISTSSPSRASPPALRDDPLPPSAGRVAPGVDATTPPPEAGVSRVDTEGINDEIVVAVIQQLEKTGNRPHLLKELAAILQHSLPIVQSSANQPAIISSRLATYMKRPWTALAPCPIGKELIGTHPKRIYFYLTTQPRQAFPDPPERADQAARIISPSLTSAENEEDDKQARSRAALSPSPEVDLSTPELEQYESPLETEYFPHGHALSRFQAHDGSTTSLAQSQSTPPLEGDEREFTQTATSLQQRHKSESMDFATRAPPATKVEPVDEIMTEDSEESRARHNRSDAAALFGQGDSHLSIAKVSFMESSPMLRPQVDFDMLVTHKLEVHDIRLSDEYDSNFLCETVEMDELDDLFATY
ncbi:uncharacterized protein PV09_01320 [Verruconis gallopava]|uniref:GDS1 winged helix domain-containing protein n=1 Tax=Verruconis gallopava TaxID=253628 RepID=A0A0D2BAS8_9PEZI|nr:uncharacterized protein PV09_01320 [Verruconis gallopava]KIW08414.1 hypothetical protein PV09_01320 [Verruconis gallopava]